MKNGNEKWRITACVTTQNPDCNFDLIKIPVVHISPTDNQTVVESVLNTYHPSILLYFGWSWMIPPSVYRNFTSLILHPSPLPKYRGGSPIQNQIIAGESMGAVTLFKATEKMDSGPIYAQNSIPLKGTMETILHHIVRVGTEITISTLTSLSDNTLQPTDQDESHATYCKRRMPSDSEITLNDFQSMTSRELYNKIRSLADPYPNAYICCKDGKKVYFTGANIDEEHQ